MSNGLAVDHRTYGNWTEPKTPGITRSLGLVGTFAVFAALIFEVIVARVDFWVALGLLPFLLAALVPLGLHRGGRNYWQIAVNKLVWWHGRRKRQHIYLAPLVTGFGAHPLPGLLAASRLYGAADAHGESFALIHIPGAAQITALLAVTPVGDELVDDDDVDTMVAHYGEFLANLAHEPGLDAAAVVIETAPDPGYRLAAEVNVLTKPDAPQLAKTVLADCARTYPRGSASISSHVAVTYSMRRPNVGEKELGGKADADEEKIAPVQTVEEMATLIGSRLPGLRRQLGVSGAGSPRSMSPADVTEMVAVAYDPAMAATAERASATGEPLSLDWGDIGPVGGWETWGAYRHNDAASVTWTWVHPPKGAVPSNVLDDLLAPHEDVTRKRVTMLYRPHDPGSATDIVDQDVRTARGHHSTSQRGAATTSAALEATVQSAKEEARGAGVERFALMVTATVLTPAPDSGDTLRRRVYRAEQAVTQSARASRTPLRVMWGSQSPSFAAALGVGIIPTRHVNVPDLVRDNL